jgi:hypothetical protein
MGAQTFSNLEVVKGDARDAYRQACQEANDYNGHQEGYSGDIQTTDGFRILKDNPRFGTKAFNKWEDDILMNDKYGISKWESCGCVEITGANLKRLKERRGLKGRKGYRAFYFFGWGAC